MQFDRTVVAFFVLFLTVYFLESIGGFYMTSAIVSIERQFQIPSKISGLMVSAGDFGYIPSVVFVSYLGGKGNRAKWIGGGCMLIAIANLLISSSNFLFPVETVSLNTSILEQSIEWDTRRLDTGAYAHQGEFTDFVSQLSPELQLRMAIPHDDDEAEVVSSPSVALRTTTARAVGSPIHYSEWLSPLYYCFKPTESGANSTRGITDANCRAFFAFLRKYNAASKEDVEKLRLLSATSFAYCDKALNGLRGEIQQIRCGNRRVSNFGPTAVIFLGLLLLGVGRTMPFSLGLPLIDDNVRKTNLPLYFAGMFSIRILGPLVGMMLGAITNKYYYTSEVPPGITPKDPMWIGRWWSGFLLVGLVLFGPSLGLFCFRAPDPEAENGSEGNKERGKKRAKGGEDGSGRLVDGKEAEKLIESNGAKAACDKRAEAPKKQARRRGLALVDRHAERDAEGKTVVPSTLRNKINDFTSTISSVLREKVYVGTLCGRIIDVMAFKGFHIFLPKYIELQFGIPQYKINAYMGTIGIVGFALGILGGSLGMKVFKLEGRRVAAWVTACGAIAACLSIGNAFIGCKSTMSNLGDSVATNFNGNSSCLRTCNCAGVPLYPVCDDVGTVFYSPCHAGCLLNISAYRSQPSDMQASPTFGNCRCTQGASRVVSRDQCRESECERKVIYYFMTMALGGVVGGMGVVPGMLILLRSVPPKHRSLSLGFNGFLVSLLATLPSPILWGALIDHFCIFWGHRCTGDSGGSRGHCSLYATDRLRVWLHFVYGGLRLFSMLTDLFVIYHARDLKITGEETPSKQEKDADQDEEEKESGEGDGDSGGEETRSEGVIGGEAKASEAGVVHRKHRRSTSRDLSPSEARRKRSEEMDNWRKSSNMLPGPITEI